MQHHDKIICLDIETMPDRTLISDWDEGKFPPKPIWHQIVAISFVEARIERDTGPEKYVVTCCRSGGKPEWDERRLLCGFWQYFGENAPRVVTWNGKGFDLPVLACPRDDARHLRTLLVSCGNKVGQLHPAFCAGLALRLDGAALRLQGVLRDEPR